MNSVMRRLGKGYIQKDIYCGTARIGEAKHPKQERSGKSNTMSTNHTMTNNSNPYTTNVNLGASEEALIR